VEEAVSIADLPGGGLIGKFAVVEIHGTGKTVLWPFLNLLNQLACFEGNRGVSTILSMAGWSYRAAGLLPRKRGTCLLSAKAGGRALVHGLGYRPCRVSQDLGVLAVCLSADWPARRW